MKKLFIRPLTDAEVLKFSNGEVKKPETMSYRNLVPEPDGLFCQKIFGPLVDFTCLCNKKFKSSLEKKCDTCGVSYIKSDSRRKRFGHISLNCPLVHIWFFKSLPSKLGIILNMSSNKLSDIIYYKKYIIVFSSVKKIKKKRLLNELEYLNLLVKYKKKILALTGAEAIEYLLAFLSLDKEIKRIKNKKKILKSDIEKLKILYSFKKNNFSARNLVIRNIPVIPAGLRPLVNIGKDKFASSDLNELYKKIIISNNRLKKLSLIGAPNFIIINEKRILQESLDSLFDNSKSSKYSKKPGNTLLKSLSDNLRGKKGRFRFNLLGKRVDFSGRSVIVVDPKIKFGYCSIPYHMVVELFKPFILGFFKKKKNSTGIYFSLNISLRKKRKVTKILKKIIKKYPVLLNRAPTLHRLNIQSFYPKITRGKAIKIHPLICSAFNADFDGDQMAVHIPLSQESLIEAKRLLFAKKNFISPSNGNISIPLTQEAVLGIFLITKKKFSLSKIKYFNSFSDAVCYSYITSESLNEEVYIKYKNVYVNTSVGRALVFDLVPCKELFLEYNKNLKKADINSIIYKVYTKLGIKKAQKLTIRLMNLGFDYVTKSGISISNSDIKLVKEKKKIISSYVSVWKKKILDNISLKENDREKQNIIFWNSVCSEINLLAKKANTTKIGVFCGKKYLYKSNSNIYDIVSSGSKGTKHQMFQINGMRGLVAKNSKKIIDFPIISSLKEGMNSYEYFISTYGARKGLMDTSLKTADSGYLTRRLVDVSQNVVISSIDCFSKKGFIINSKDKYVKNIKGRVLVRNFYSKTGKLVLKKNSIIDDKFLKKFLKIGGYIVVRSPIFCESKSGLCSYCYGTDLISNNLVSLGEAVGVIAAQSIGEPGTQLTMRTFHTGGVLTSFVKGGEKNKRANGFIKFSSNLRFIKFKKKKVPINCGFLYLLSYTGKVLLKKKVFPFDDISLFKKGFLNKKISSCIKKDDFYIVRSTLNGICIFKNIRKCIFKKYIFKEFSLYFLKYVPKSSAPYVIIKNDKENYILNIKKNDILIKYNKNVVKKGVIIKVTFIKSGCFYDITNSLIKVSNTFENRDCLNPSFNYFKKNTVIVNKKIYNSINKKKNVINLNEYNFNSPLNKKFFYKGDFICKKKYDLTQFLLVYGVEKFVKYFTCKICKIYSNYGIEINSRHIEVILSRMLSFVVCIRSKNKFLIRKKIKKKNICNYKDSYFINFVEGITNVSLKDKSFISSASFQNTIKILLKSAFKFKIDDLKGVKENVIIGKKIPVGTGFF
ncbi:DNA-directed RNA polymerase subunit beta' [Candidatus Vidania fulgoroideorum]